MEKVEALEARRKSESEAMLDFGFNLQTVGLNLSWRHVAIWALNIVVARRLYVELDEPLG